MENQVDERSKSSYILRFVKVSRIILFGSAIGMVTYFGLHAPITYYLSSITGPFFMIFLDLIMFNKSKDQFKEFYLVSVIICLIALFIAVAALFPLVLFPYISSVGGAIFYLLGFGVMIVSFIELLTLIYLTRPQERYDEEVWESKEDVRESKRDTIDIQ